MLSRAFVLSTWRRTLALSWPVAVQQTLNTLMRTVDIIVTGLFSPVAVAAVGLADLYAQIPMRVGHGFGAGAIALSSQDTGRGDTRTRNQAVTQAFVLGFLIGLPLIGVGVLTADVLIEILGAESEVVRLGGLYLAIVFAASPVRIVGIVGARSLQGTGDTRTPMVVNGTANVLNIVLTVGLGLGIGGFPRLGIVGVGLATAISRTFEAVAISGAIASDFTDLAFARPESLTITRQIVAVSLPNFAEGMSTSIANLPFNALLLVFGTEVNAAYHISRRIYQQLTGPLYRSLKVGASIIVGQALGEGTIREARRSGLAITALGILTLGVSGAVVIAGANPLAAVFTDDPETIRRTASFTRVFGISMFFYGFFFPLSGCLIGAGDTLTPFLARFTGMFVFMLGLSYLLGIVLGYGLPGIYAGIILGNVWRALVVLGGFLWGDWSDVATKMMDERADLSD